MDGARDLARWGVRAALGFQRAGVAVKLAGAVEHRVVLRHTEPWCGERAAMFSELLPRRADVDVAILVVVEVSAGEGPVLALGLVEHRDVRFDTLLVDQPGEHLGRAVTGVGRQARGGHLGPMSGAR